MGFQLTLSLDSVLLAALSATIFIFQWSCPDELLSLLQSDFPVLWFSCLTIQPQPQLRVFYTELVLPSRISLLIPAHTSSFLPGTCTSSMNKWGFWQICCQGCILWNLSACQPLFSLLQRDFHFWNITWTTPILPQILPNSVLPHSQKWRMSLILHSLLKNQYLKVSKPTFFFY